MTYLEVKEKLGNRNSRKLRYETYLEDLGDCIGVRHHKTYIIRFYPDGSSVYNCAGWHTRTTKDRLNDYGEAHVWQKAGIWYVSYQGKEFLYHDGIRFEPDGGCDGEGIEKAKQELKLRKSVKQYAKKYVSSLKKGEIPAPSGGDCWDCLIFNKSGDPKPYGEHLTSHIKERYFVPSLAVNALEQRGSTAAKMLLSSCFSGEEIPDVFQCGEFAFGNASLQSDFLWSQIENSITRFMFRELGLVS